MTSSASGSNGSNGSNGGNSSASATSLAAAPAHTETVPLGEVPAPTPGVDMGALVGRPHLFGRVKQLRSGVLIEPFGVLTLQSDGRITGYADPNEGSWQPYLHGEVPGERAFAFLTRANHWIPSSTWTQSMGDIPIGHFCDEPEATLSAQRFCLVPQTPMPRATRIVYLVASCLHFYERTVPVLLGQLFAEGIRPDQIKVVVNGCERDDDETIEGVDHAFSRHNAWEWTALYEAPLRWGFDYAFLIHDTSVVFPGFRRSVEGANGHVAWDHLPATPMARCLLGLYAHKFLTRLNPWLKSVDGIDKRNGILAEVGGELLLRAHSALVIGDPEYNGALRTAEWRETADFFNTGTPRIRRVFPSVKVHKFIHAGPGKANSL